MKFYDSMSSFTCPPSHIMSRARAKRKFSQLDEDVKYVQVFYEVRTRKYIYIYIYKSFEILFCIDFVVVVLLLLFAAFTRYIYIESRAFS